MPRERICGAAIGAVAPAFSRRDQTDAPVTLRQMRGHITILTFLDATCTAECPITAQFLDWTAQFLGKDTQNVGWLTMSVTRTNTADDAETVIKRSPLAWPLARSP